MLYHGVDIIEVERVRRAVERWGDRFLRRVFTPGELADCGVVAGAPDPGIMHGCGEMAEWSKARDSKSRIRQRIQGSNPCLSAR